MIKNFIKEQGLEYFEEANLKKYTNDEIEDYINVIKGKYLKKLRKNMAQKDLQITANYWKIQKLKQ